MHGAHRRRGAEGDFLHRREKGTQGLSYGAQEQKIGWNSQPTAAVNFENCRVPVANLIGKKGDGFKIAMAGLDGGRLNIGACSIGGAQFCLDRAIEYMRERKQFGTRLADFQAPALPCCRLSRPNWRRRACSSGRPRPRVDE